MMRPFGRTDRFRKRTDSRQPMPSGSKTAFQARLTAFTNEIDEFDHRSAPGVKRGPSLKALPHLLKTPAGKPSGPRRIDKSALTFPEPRRIRDRDHVRYVAKQPCLICGRQPSDPHHVRFAQSRALGRKVSDEFVVPLCRGHHREIHLNGDEAAWWSKIGVDPTVAARTLWLVTHPRPSEQDKRAIAEPAGKDETKPFAPAGAP